MGRYMHKQCESTGWLNHHECPDPSMLGVMIKLGHNQHSIHPSTLHPMTILAINVIDAAIAFTMASEVTSTLFRQMSPYQSEILVQPQGIRIPIFESLEDVMQLDSKILIGDYSCIVRRERIVLVWSNTVDNVLPHGSEVEKLLLETVSHDLQTLKTVDSLFQIWGQSSSRPISRTLPFLDQNVFSRTPTPLSLSPPTANALVNEKNEVNSSTAESKRVSQIEEQEIYDPESATRGTIHRPSTSCLSQPPKSSELPESSAGSTLFSCSLFLVILTHSFMVGLGMLLIVVVQMGGVSQVTSTEAILSSCGSQKQLIGEICTDGNYLRLCYLALIPLSSTFALFFATTLVSCLFQLFGPVGDIRGNSRYHSAVAPDPARHRGIEYPHITIQMPVYMEGLTG